MDLSTDILLNFFSLGALIPFVFTTLAAAFLLLIREKSRATFHLGLAFLWVSCFNVGYVVAGAWYHPDAAFHRWITVGFIMIALTHFAQFLLHFPETRGRRFALALLAVQWTGALIVAAVFFRSTLDARPVFQFAGHYWDFAADALSRTIGQIIFLYILIILLIGIVRTILVRGRERFAILAITLALMLVYVVPGVANILSRDGALDRGLFQTLYDLLSVIGFFALSVIYINSKKDSSTFMGKVIGISVVTFLVVLQFFAFIFIQVKEGAYDETRRNQVALILNGRPPPADFVYMRLLSPGMTGGIVVRGPDDIELALPLGDADLRHTVLHARLAALGSAGFQDRALRLLETTLPHPGYLALAREVFAGGPGSAGLLETIASIQRPLLYARNKLKDVPPADFAAALALRHAGAEGPLRAFLGGLVAARDLAIVDRPTNSFGATGARDGEAEAAARKERVLRWLAPMKPPGSRIYRGERDQNRHYVAYLRQSGPNLYEVGFSYRAYRRYLDEDARQVFYILVAVLGLILFGFQLFFKGSLLDPLNSLLTGVRQVNDGRLDVQVPVRVQDEIGYLSRSFNGMMGIIRDSIETRTRMADSFARFVPRQFLQFLERDDITNVEPGDAVSRELTVLFTDIRGFAALSETMSPEETFLFLNALFRRMNPLIHENNGFVDKFIGDAIMALFPDAQSALRASLAMTGAVAEYNRERQGEDREPIAIGIGLHAGDVMLGTLGSESRLDTTVIGDTVNLASRIESLTRYFGVDLIISDAVYRRLPAPEDFRLREIDAVQVKGKRRPVVLYEAYDQDRPEALEAKDATAEDFQKALQLFKAGDFQASRESWQRCRDRAPVDPLPPIYLKRCAELIERPPENWTGVVRMDQK